MAFMSGTGPSLEQRAVSASRSPLMLITDEYRNLNYEMHQRGGYGVSGFHYAQIVRDMMAKWKCETALDYGCGQRTLRKALEPLTFDLREYDPALPERAGMPQKADLVICTEIYGAH